MTSPAQEAPPEMRPEPPAPSSTPDLSGAIGRLAHAIDRIVSPGDVAALRRMDPSDPSTAAFWRLRASHLAPAGLLPEADPWREDAEKRWATIMIAMAHLSGLHAPGMPLGSALARAGFSELRFVRLLQARGDVLPRLAIESSRFLAAKGQPVDQKGLALLVLSDGWIDPSSTERVRRSIARDYYADATN